MDDKELRVKVLELALTEFATTGGVGKSVLEIAQDMLAFVMCHGAGAPKTLRQVG